LQQQTRKCLKKGNQLLFYTASTAVGALLCPQFLQGYLKANAMQAAVVSIVLCKNVGNTF
jgi:hypothetical protein